MENNKLRITSGDFRGRSIFAPKTDKTHPMGSREKIALFNTLGLAKFSGNEIVLDCYSGSGALGIEALSRGAKKVFFVDSNPLATATATKNIEALSIPKSRVGIITKKVEKLSLEDFLDGQNFDGFDLILLDPPYSHFVLEEFNSIDQFLKENGLIALSMPKNFADCDNIFPNLQFLSCKSYAAACIAIYRKK